MMTVQEIESKLEYLERANQTSVEIPKLSEGILSIEKLCSKDGRKEQIARSLVLRATLDVYQNDIESAKTNYLKSRQIANELKLARIILDCDSGLAQIEFLSGNNKQAHINTISIHYNSLRIGYTFRIAYCKVLLGLISQSSDLEDEAL